MAQINTMFGDIVSCRSASTMLHRDEAMALFAYHDVYISIE